MRNIFDIITNPGDRMDARVTETGRQVINIKKGDVKLSAVRYSSGRIVETRSYMPGSRNATNLLEDLNR